MIPGARRLDGAHTRTRAFAASGGVPNRPVPDIAKVAVIKGCLYERWGGPATFRSS